MSFPFPTNYYLNVHRMNPPIGNHIMSTFSRNSIVLYLACRDPYARYAAVNQNFRRASIYEKINWTLRPTFLSIINSTSWATKPSQDRILALTVTRKGFEKMLEMAVMMQGEVNPESEFFWEPEPDPFGEVTDRNSIVLKIQGEILERFLDTMVNKVYDVTAFVRRQRRCLLSYRGVGMLQIPDECPYLLLKEFIGPLINLDLTDSDEECDY